MAEQMFNADQRAYMEYLGSLPPEKKCPCGWYVIEECPDEARCPNGQRAFLRLRAADRIVPTGDEKPGRGRP